MEIYKHIYPYFHYSTVMTFVLICVDQGLELNPKYDLLIFVIFF